MKPGYKTTEFWQAVAAQALALLTLVGVVSPGDSKTLEEAIGKCIAAVAALIANGLVVVCYIKARFSLKFQANGNGSNGHSANGEAARQGPPLPMLAGLAAGLFFMAGPAQAQHLLPWRHQIDQRLKQHDQLIAQLIGQQRQAPPPGPIILQPQPRQDLPIQGDPHQQLPVPGDPRQALPIPGDPRQQLPPTNPPRQDLPIPGEPRQYMPPASYTLLHRALAAPIR